MMRVTETSVWSDLVVDVEPPKFSPSVFGAQLLSGRQLIVLTSIWPTVRTDMTPLPDVDMPLDVAIAGGEA